MDAFNDSCDVTCIHKEDIEYVRGKMINESTVVSMAEIFKALGDSTRIKIIYILSIKELCVCDITEALGMNQSAISHQLRVLRNLRLVKYRRDGKIIYYSLDDNHILHLFNEGLEHVRHSV
jgi:ArsR family transcriptional regulator, lead/cadmium/zinc/bismuth-responsive transcriptional repressor